MRSLSASAPAPVPSGGANTSSSASAWPTDTMSLMPLPRKFRTASSSSPMRWSTSSASIRWTPRQPSHDSVNDSGTTISTISVRMLTLKGTERCRTMSACGYAAVEQRRRIEAGRVLAPGVTARDHIPSDLKEPVHIASFEGLCRPLIEALGNPGRVVVHAVAPGEHEELEEITDALRADQGRDRPAGDAERASIDGLEVRPGPRVADDEEPRRPPREPPAQALGLGRVVEAKVAAAERRWIEHDLRHRAAVDMHLLEMLAAACDIDHDRRERTRDRGRGEQDLGDKLRRIPSAARGDRAEVPQHADRHVEVGRGHQQEPALLAE